MRSRQNPLKSKYCTRLQNCVVVRAGKKTPSSLGEQPPDKNFPFFYQLCACPIHGVAVDQGFNWKENFFARLF